VRVLDRVLILLFLSFAITSFVFDPYTAIDVDLASSSHPPAKLIFWFATHVDPLILHPPLYLRVMVGISVLVLGPLYLVLIYALWFDRSWITWPALIYASIKLYSMVVYIAVALEAGPRDVVMFWATYLPYVIAPVLLLIRIGYHR
jgi:hypothetical protein